MYRDPGAPARPLLSARTAGAGPGAAAAAALSLALALSLSLSVSGCGGSSSSDQEGPGIALSFSSKALLVDANTVALYFYEPSQDCTRVRRVTPRPPPLLGPFTAALGDAQRQQGLTITRTDIPVGTWTVLVDAIARTGALVGSGCAENQVVRDQQVSKIQIQITAP